MRCHHVCGAVLATALSASDKTTARAFVTEPATLISHVTPNGFAGSIFDLEPATEYGPRW